GQDCRAQHPKEADDPGDTDAERRPLHPPFPRRRHEVDEDQQEQDERAQEEESDRTYRPEHETLPRSDGECTTVSAARARITAGSSAPACLEAAPGHEQPLVDTT